MLSFWSGFEKRAAGIATLRKATDALKRSGNLIRRGIRASEEGTGSFTGHGRPLGPGTIPNVPGAPAGTHGKIFAKGNTSSMLGMEAGPKQREVANRLMLLHESFERKHLTKKPTLWLGSHADPAVILKEQNAIATLPKGYGKVRSAFTELRGNDRTRDVLETAIPGFQYGKRRYSRHAIKRMREILNEKGFAPTPIKGEG